jgi:tetratricopeptide (TPR) repeat protein
VARFRAVVCLAGTLLALVSAHDREGAWRRVEAFMAGPPERTPVERAKTWDYLGSSWFQAGRYADAARAFGHEAETSRSQRVYLQWALAANEARDYAQAQRVLEDLVAFAPGTALAWQQLGALSWQRGDYGTAARAARTLAQLAPDNAALQQNARDVERFYTAWRDSVKAR